MEGSKILLRGEKPGCRGRIVASNGDLVPCPEYLSRPLPAPERMAVGLSAIRSISEGSTKPLQGIADKPHSSTTNLAQIDPHKLQEVLYVCASLLFIIGLIKILKEL